MEMNNNEIDNNKKKTSKGRQKIKIKKIEKKNRLLVTFSKRRQGLFKKAAELSVLCGVDVAVAVTSPAGKIFAFGNPSPDFVFERFLSPTRSSNEGRLDQLIEPNKEIEKREDDHGGRFWWEEDVGHLGLGELERYVVALEELRSKLISKANYMALAREYSSSFVVPRTRIGGHEEKLTFVTNPPCHD